MIPILPDNVNASPSMFVHLARFAHLLVSNAFYTIQGEGPWAGNPAVFFRLAGCNLGKKEHCQFCDADFRMNSGKKMTPIEVVDFIARKTPNPNLIVLTGGEPLLQLAALEVVLDVITRQCGSKLFQFETNGILLTEDVLVKHKNWLFVVSPKILRDHYEPIPAFWKKHRDHIALKYVVSADPESPYHNIPSPQELSGMTVFISGMTEYGEHDLLTQPGKPANLLLMSRSAQMSTADNYAYAAKLALDKGYRLSYQMHMLGSIE